MPDGFSALPRPLYRRFGDHFPPTEIELLPVEMPDGQSRRAQGRLDPLRSGPTPCSGVIPVHPELVAGVRYFGRNRSGAIRDGMLLT